MVVFPAEISFACSEVGRLPEMKRMLNPPTPGRNSFGWLRPGVWFESRRGFCWGIPWQ